MKERLKSIALGLQIALMLVLFVLSIAVSVRADESFGPLYRLSRWLRGEAAPRMDVVQAVQPAAYPTRIVAAQESGLTTAFGRDSVSTLFAKLQGLLDEALGSAQLPQSIDQQEYLSLITQAPGFWLEYDGKIPLYALRIWAGAGESEGYEQTIGELALVLRRNEVLLVFAGPQGFYRCNTAADPKALQNQLGGCTPDGSFFAAQAPVDGEGINPYAALRPQEPVPAQSLSATSYGVRAPSFVATDLPRDLLSCFSMNPYLVKSYDDLGAQVYVQGNYTLRIAANGGLDFTVAGGEGLGGERAETAQGQAVALLNRARGVLQGVLEQCGGEQNLSLHSISPLNREGNYTMVFGREVDGLPLSGQDITVKTEKGVIVSMELRTFSLVAQSTVPLLPHRQAAAALGEQNQVRLLPRYRLQDGQLLPYLSYTAE